MSPHKTETFVDINKTDPDLLCKIEKERIFLLHLHKKKENYEKLRKEFKTQLVSCKRTHMKMKLWKCSCRREKEEIKEDAFLPN